MLWLAHLLLEDDDDSTQYAVIVVAAVLTTIVSILCSAINAVASNVTAALNAED